MPFVVDDFGDDANWTQAVTQHQLGPYDKHLKSSAYTDTKDGLPNLSATTLGVSEVMQGSALYKPTTSVYNQFNQSLSSDLRTTLVAAGGTSDVLGERVQFLPYDVMNRKLGVSDAKLSGIYDGYINPTDDKDSDPNGTGANDPANSGSGGGGSGGGGFNSVGTGSSGQFLSTAANYIGHTESPPGSNMNEFAVMAGHPNGNAWCMTFVVAMCKQAGVALPSWGAYTPTTAAAFQSAGQWITSDPQPGDIVFFDFPNDSVYRIQHVGIVERPNQDGSITTIEGNTSSTLSGSQDNGGGVYRKIRRPSGGIVGYGRPKFAEPAKVTIPTTGTTSAGFN